MSQKWLTRVCLAFAVGWQSLHGFIILKILLREQEYTTDPTVKKCMTSKQHNEVVETILDATDVTPGLIRLSSGTIIMPGRVWSPRQELGAVYNHLGMVYPTSRRFETNYGGWQGDDFPGVLSKKLENAVPLVDKLGEKVGKRILYGGFLNLHYGHFLIEGLTRIWPLLYYQYDTIVMFCRGLCSGAEGWMNVALGHLSRTKNNPPPKLVVLTNDTYFSGVYMDIPTMAWNPNDSPQFHPIMKRVYGTISESARRDSGSWNNITARVLLRRDLGTNNLHKTFSNEANLAEMMSSRFGFVSYDPSTLSFSEQLSLFSSAHILAGRTGTSMHNVVFLPPGAHAINIEDDRRTGRIQYELGAMMNITATVLPHYGNITSPDNGTSKGVIFQLPLYAEALNHMLL